MPSPFPGMDPYLERPDVFPDLHDTLVTLLRMELNERLPPPYFATTANRIWVETSHRRVWPDVGVHASNGGPAGDTRAGGAAVLTAEANAVRVRVPLLERKETFVEIYRQEDGARLVTSIEVLSPSNKTRGADGRDQYLKKQREMLGRQVHLVEIDLLRAGDHTTAVPWELAHEAAGPFDYHVCIAPMTDRAEFLVYRMLLTAPLPEIAVPLLEDVGSVKVPLQALFNRAYDTGPYRRSVRYDLPPLPPLSPGQAEWAQRILADKGLLPSSSKGQP